MSLTTIARKAERPRNPEEPPGITSHAAGDRQGPQRRLDEARDHRAWPRRRRAGDIVEGCAGKARDRAEAAPVSLRRKVTGTNDEANGRQQDHRRDLGLARSRMTRRPGGQNAACRRVVARPCVSPRRSSWRPTRGRDCHVGCRRRLPRARYRHGGSATPRFRHFIADERTSPPPTCAPSAAVAMATRCARSAPTFGGAGHELLPPRGPRAASGRGTAGRSRRPPQDRQRVLPRRPRREMV